MNRRVGPEEDEYRTLEGRGEKKARRQNGQLCCFSYGGLSAYTLRPSSISAQKIFSWMTFAICSQLTMCQWKITHSTVFGKANWSLLVGKLRHYETWIGNGVSMGRVEREKCILPQQVLWHYQRANEYILNNKI